MRKRKYGDHRKKLQPYSPVLWAGPVCPVVRPHTWLHQAVSIYSHHSRAIQRLEDAARGKRDIASPGGPRS